MIIRDVLKPELRVVFCGTALGTKSAQLRAYYAGPGNAFWPTLYRIGLTPRQLRPEEYRSLLTYGIGLTDLCKVRSGSDKAIGYDAFDVADFAAKLRRYSPGWVAFNGERAAEVLFGKRVSYGEHPERVAGIPVFVLPSTSLEPRRASRAGPPRSTRTGAPIHRPPRSRPRDPRPHDPVRKAPCLCFPRAPRRS